MRICLTLFALAGFTTLFGCGETGVPSDMAEVTGEVTQGGSPVADAAVTFQATSGNTSGFGRTDEEGKYTLTSGSPAGGVEPGEYVVTVTKTETTGSEAVPEDHPDYDGQAPDEEVQVKQLLPAEYADPDSTPLEATVTEGQNEVPLELED